MPLLIDDILSISLVCSVALKFTFMNVINGCIFLRITGLIHKRHRSPWLWNDVVYSWTPSGREHDKCLQIIHGFTNKVIGNPAHFFVISPFLSLLILLLFFCFVFLLLVLFPFPPLCILLRSCITPPPPPLKEKKMMKKEICKGLSQYSLLWDT